MSRARYDAKPLPLVEQTAGYELKPLFRDSIQLPATIHASRDPRDLRSGTASTGR